MTLTGKHIKWYGQLMLQKHFSSTLMEILRGNQHDIFYLVQFMIGFYRENKIKQNFTKLGKEVR